MIVHSNFPNEMVALPHWVCWRAEPDEARPGKIKKLPIDAKTGAYAASNNPATWCDFETAIAQCQQYDHLGLGFMFSGSGLFGVDIDDISEAINGFVDGEDTIATEFIDTLQSYAEVSQSGNGLHIICKGTLPQGGRRKGNVEMYDSGRFFVMTGKHIGGYELSDGTEAIKPLHAKYIGAPKPSDVCTNIQPIDLDATEIVDAIRKSSQGNAFEILYSGRWQGLYSSQSDADLALCNMLAFWCARDEKKMDSIFRSSGLMRDKWDSKRGQAGKYGEITIRKACDGCTDVWQPTTDDFHITVLDMETRKVRENKPKRLYAWDDTGNGELFLDVYGGSVKYSYTDKRWYWYNGLKWEVSQKGEIDFLIDALVKTWEGYRKYYIQEDDAEMAKAWDKWIKKIRTRSTKKAWIEESMHLVAADTSEFDVEPMHLNVQNGIIDLSTITLEDRPHGAMVSKITNTEYSNKLDCPQWKSFLLQIFDGDKELIRYIQKALGYTLTGSTAEQCIFFCVGDGRNGKSTFLDTVRDVLGDYATNIQPETIMVKRGATGSSDIARLRSARMVTCSEPNEGSRLDEGLIKQLSGGDKVTARFLYGNEFEFTPQFKLWMGTNHKPIIRGRDEGIWRRIRIIPFNVRIPDDKVNKNLKYDLRKEYPAILNWMVEGCILWQREGLELPQCMQESIKEYRNEMDVISMFIENCCRLDGECKAGELYAKYKEWAIENNEYCMTSTKFGIEISKRFEKRIANNGSYYRGISVPIRLN